jgi:hypothetical protein
MVELPRRARSEQHQRVRIVIVDAAHRRFALAFAVAFPLFYAAARVCDLALFTVYPSFGIVVAGMHRSRDVVDPAMEFLAPEVWWYGWLSSAAIGAFVFGLVASLIPWRLRSSFCALACVTPVIAMIACVYLTLPWFRL